MTLELIVNDGIEVTQTRVFRVEVTARDGRADGNSPLARSARLIVAGVQTCVADRLYFLRGDLTHADVDRLCQALLADPVTETYHIAAYAPHSDEDGAGLKGFQWAGGEHHWVEVALLPGVTDPAAESLVQAAPHTGITGLTQAATGTRYWLTGALERADLHHLATGFLANPLIQYFSIEKPIQPPFIPAQPPDTTVEVIPLRAASDDELLQISQTRRLALDLAEMRAIRAYYQQTQREPTDAELETLAQTWSEHCVHKTFKAHITYIGPQPGADPYSPPTTQTVDGLLRTYIRAATDKVAKPWVRSAFVDNAGIVAFTEGWDLAFKVETHNHPSALEPFGGANTGVGGVIRDVLGVSARPIANTDVLCFGPSDLSESDLLPGVLHPRRVAAGVVHGIEDYGNKMGIPTVNGAIVYHPGYTANPLVYCGCLGILPTGAHPSQAQPGDLIIVLGGRTGRDGLRGATFSSMEMDQATGGIAGSAVQIGHPIHEKGALEAVLRARDEKLYHAITDCGAGGLSSAVGEMGASLGATVQLADVPLKYPGLRPWEIWLSEAQERMVLAVAPQDWPRLREVCAGQDTEAVCIGEFEATGQLRLFYGEQLVGDLAMHFVHDGIPRRRLDAVWTPPAELDLARSLPQPQDLRAELLSLLAHPNIRSKESVIRRYDHEVQGSTMVKPLVGHANHGPSDAAVLVPFDTYTAYPPVPSPTWGEGDEGVATGVALSVGLCPTYGMLDPYAMAWAAIDEAFRNAVAVGADPDRVAILDNFCWGNPARPDRLGSLVRCSQGCYDAAVAYGAPFISGKDSLNNEFAGPDGQRRPIPGTLLISALGIVPDIQRSVTMDLKAADNLLYLVGDTRDELGGSHYALLHQESGGQVPQPVPDALDRLRPLHRAIRADLVQACHDLSEGGLGVALAEMCLAGGLGAAVDLATMAGAASINRDDTLLFSESLCRFLVEVRPADSQAFEAALAGIPLACIGHVLATPEVHVRGRDGRLAIQASVTDLDTAWRDPEAPPTVDHRPPTADKTESPVFSLQSSVLSPPKRVLILHARGSNRDREAARACELSGGAPEIVHVNQLLAGERRLLDYHMLVLPGGFSYGDDLGAGTLWALDLRRRLGDDLTQFIADGRPVLGICNGFQALVKAGILPGEGYREQGAGNRLADYTARSATLTFNESAHFECRWVYLQPNAQSRSIFTQGLDDLIYCPVAHGEGRLAADADTVAGLAAAGLIALTYVNARGGRVGYPLNPNGSVASIAGLTNSAGNVLGLMPHPEDHIFAWHHPNWRRGEGGMSGLVLFENGIKNA